jgi:hypothetical protein
LIMRWLFFVAFVLFMVWVVIDSGALEAVPQ